MTHPTRNPPIYTPYTPSNEAASLSNQAMLATVLFLFLVAVFIFFFYLYAKYRLRSLREDHLVFADSDQITGQGLDSELLKTLPVKNYLVSEFKDGLECAVCLSELSEGEQLRLLPKCNHGFHVDCIDKWFHAHTTCPLCRTPVTDTEEPVKVEIQEGTQNLNLPTNVLFWGNQDQVSHGVRNQTEEEDASSSSSTRVNNPEGMLVIDIPRRGVEVDFVPPTVSPLPTSKFPSEEARTPMSVRLRSLTRLLSRGKMVIGFSSSSPSSSSSSPKGGDIEQGIVEGSSSFAPKTPISK